MTMDAKKRHHEIDELAAFIEQYLTEIYGEKMGFALFMFPIGAETGDYVSNCERAEMIKFMRLTADRIEVGMDIGRIKGTA